MRASRLLSILMMLQVRGRITAETLAQEFEVSIRTIYRDIDELCASGIPIFSDRGPGGGFAFLNGYQTPLTGLASAEAEAMFMIGMPSQAEALGLGAEAAQAGRKLLAALPAPWHKGAARISARFHLDPIDWYRLAEPVAHLPMLARAVLDQFQISMRYKSWTTIKQWVVDPMGLVQKAGAWYMVARGAKAIRIFKVANIVDQIVRGATFERPDDFNLAEYWVSAIKRFESELRPDQASICASPLGLSRLSQLGAYAAQAVSSAIPCEPEGWMSLRLPIESIDSAALTLLGLGPEIEVLQPNALRRRLRQLAEQVLQRQDKAARAHRGAKKSEESTD